MVWVPAGSFRMGSSIEELDAVKEICQQPWLGWPCPDFKEERPQRDVWVDGFWIDQNEVTNRQFETFVEAASYVTDAEKRGGAHSWRYYSTSGREDHPVVGVSWNDASAYCQWYGKRLPTEAEWEKAASWNARQGTKGRYPWGDEWGADRCNNVGQDLKDTTPVGQYIQAGGDSPCGASDMAGNVWEWTSNKWGARREKPSFGYPYDHSDGREARPGTEFRVLRGGSFYDGPGWCHSSARYPHEATKPADYIGFRVVRVVKEEADVDTP